MHDRDCDQSKKTLKWVLLDAAKETEGVGGEERILDGEIPEGREGEAEEQQTNGVSFRLRGFIRVLLRAQASMGERERERRGGREGELT